MSKDVIVRARHRDVFLTRLMKLVRERGSDNRDGPSEAYRLRASMK